MILYKVVTSFFSVSVRLSREKFSSILATHARVCLVARTGRNSNPFMELLEILKAVKNMAIILLGFQGS